MFKTNDVKCYVVTHSLKKIKTKFLTYSVAIAVNVHSQRKITKVTHVEKTQRKTITCGVICARPKVCSKFFRNCYIGLRNDSKQSSLTGIDQIRIPGSGLDLACNGGSCRGISLKRDKCHLNFLWICDLLVEKREKTDYFFFKTKSFRKTIKAKLKTKIKHF